ncbi:MAG: hypothetical protein DWQ29_10890 [Planctomycetota bacterium]|nr:MAG: hypothetical protein DWQ29_10890 [Planctomycetota bacterium]
MITGGVFGTVKDGSDQVVLLDGERNRLAGLVCVFQFGRTAQLCGDVVMFLAIAAMRRVSR